MKVCIFQPPYSTDFSQSDAYFDLEMEAFDRCDPSVDLIVFPEYVMCLHGAFGAGAALKPQQILRPRLESL